MTATAAQIAQVRRMVAESSTDTYDDDAITAYIEAHPLLDQNGEEPTYLDYSTTPPTATENDDWIPTYDLHAAAADILEEKAASWLEKYDFSADGGSYSRSQVHDMLMKQVRYHRMRRSAKTARMHQWPKETAPSDFSWIGNLAEDDD